MRTARTLAGLLLLVLAGCESRSEGARVPSVDAGTVDATGCARLMPPSPGDAATRGAPLPNWELDGVRADGTNAPIALRAPSDSCDSLRLFVVRVVAGWCGTCRWHASHGASTLSAVARGRARFVDVLVADDDNAPPSLADARAWRARLDEPNDVAIDPTLLVRDLLPPRTALPAVALVDAHTLTLVDVLANPDGDALADRIDAELARIDGAAPPAPVARPSFDGRFSRQEADMIQDMSLHAPPPPDPTNAKADSIGAAELGRTLFGDVLLSPTGTVACASCHEADRAFTDGRPTSPEGVLPVDRNAPSIVLASYSRWQLWDGRADSLWMQALLPMEDRREFGSSRLFVAHRVFDAYRVQYEASFGPLPPLGDTARFPPSGKPGDSAWAAMTAADQESVTRVFVNVGKAIAAFERTFRGLQSGIDKYAVDTGALDDAQKDGLRAFFRAGCAQCHYGPRLTDDAFHVARFPSGRFDMMPDTGRIDGIAQLAASVFRGDGAYSDAPEVGRARQLPAVGAWTLGAFKTPSLRGVAVTSPYGHGGNVPSLADAVEAHRTLGAIYPAKFTTGDADRWFPEFDAAAGVTIVSFLGSLDLPYAR